MGKAKDKKNGRIQKAVLYRTIIPMIIMGIVIALVAFYGYKNSIVKEIENSLCAVAAATAGSYDEIYPGDYTFEEKDKYITLYKGNNDITTQYSIIDRVKKETGMDVTLFYKNARIATTLQDTYGGRYLLTGIHAGVYSAVSNSKEAKCYQIIVDDVKYYACYLPLYNNDETFVGMIGTAVKQKEIDDAAIQASIPILIITLVATIVTSLISYGYTNQMAEAIMKVRKFLGGMIGGRLDNEMSKVVLERRDELGDAGKAVVDMQNAIRVLVERDPLTSLYNRRYGGARLRNTQRHANKCGMPYSVCICDIDFFKKVNDTYGHDAGDVVLKRVADIMRKAMSGKGFAARWGGEEFLLIFDKTGIKGAVKELNKILDTIRKTEIVYGKLIIKITMSFGIVDGDHSDDYGDLLRHADERLYLGKMNGRNRIVSTDVIEDNKDNDVESKRDNAAGSETVGNRENAGISETERNRENAANSETEGNSGNAGIIETEENCENSSGIETESNGVNASSDYNGENDIEFLTKLLNKMNEQLYEKTLEEERKDDEEDDDE